MESSTEANNENTPLVGVINEPFGNRLLDPRGPYLRWIAVFFMCFLSFGKKIATFEFTWIEFI